MNFEPVTGLLNQVAERFGIPACECAVWRGHQPLYHYWTGWMDREKTVPVRGGEWYWIYSCSKLMTVTAALQLWERGKLGLDDPVAKYLPEFSAPMVKDGTSVRLAKTVMTVRHLMTMTGGFSYDQKLPSLLAEKARTGNQSGTREMIRALAQEPLEFDPGAHFRYSMCHDVLAAVLEEASGERFSDYIASHIAGPLEITGITFRPGPEQMERMPCQLCWHDEKKVLFHVDRDNTHQLTPNYDSGGAGICCRVEDYIRFADALACGGEGANGARILQPETVKMLATNQLEGTPLLDYHRETKPESEGYGLGVRVHQASDEFPVGEFGWDGAAGASAVIEPGRHLSVFYAQHVLNYLPSYAQLHPELLRRIYWCAGE